MKIKIDNGGPYEDGVIYLRLVEVEPDHIMVEALYDYSKVDDLYAPGGGLLTITAAGRVALAPNVDPALGFDLDHDARIKLDGYCEAQAAKHGAYGRGRARLAVDNT